VTIKIAPPLEGLDLNRNFPMEWAPEGAQHGAGPFPVSEPETRALVQAIVDRPNITGYIAYHTFSGVHLRPYGGYDDDHFPTADLRAYKLLGAEATKLTGYPAVSVFHEFKYEPKESIKGSSLDWLYDYLGIFGWVTELWSPQRAAGITDYPYIEWLRDHEPEDDLKLLKWNDEELDGRGYVEWYPFEHEQLGAVELGGWEVMYCWGNVPPKFLEREVAPHADFAIHQLLVSPRLEVHSLNVEPLGGGTHRIRLVLQNTGWLPTNVSEKAVERKAVRPLEVELTLPDGAKLLSGEPKVELGQLEGRVHKRSALWWGTEDATADRAKAEWVIAAPDGGELGIEARHERAGTIRQIVALQE
jgi:Zinc carboxypeptidase